MTALREQSAGSESSRPTPDGAPICSLDYLFSPLDGWPAIRPDIFQGPIGRFVLDAAPHTEADPIAVLITALVEFGAAVNRGPHMLAGNDMHPAALFAIVVAKTAKGGKGTSAAVARGLMSRVDPTFDTTRVRGGFGSGEALVDALAGSGDDESSRDGRLMVFEAEFARSLRVIGREGSTLGTAIRMAWDGHRLEARSRAQGAVVAEGYHAGVIGHITAEELRSVLASVEVYSGTANRFLWCLARRMGRLPDGGNVPNEIFDHHAAELKRNLNDARRLGTRAMRRDHDADFMWRLIYDTMGEDEPSGVLGAVTARAEPQVLRLALTYALADGAGEIGLEHLNAAWSLWRYCRASAEWIWGDKIGDPNADKLLAAIRAAGAKGLDATGQMAVFSNHIRSNDLVAARRRLEAKNLITTEEIRTDGRPRILSKAVAR